LFEANVVTEDTMEQLYWYADWYKTTRV
jgi:hypothetical protein